MEPAGRGPGGEQARARAEQALALTREAGYRLSEGSALAVLASVELDAEQPQRARQHAQQALDLHRETGQRLGQARALVILGRALQGGDPEAAVRCWQEALVLFGECGSPEADQLRTLPGVESPQPGAAGDAAGAANG